MKGKSPAGSRRHGSGQVGYAILIILVIIIVYFHKAILHPASVIYSPNSDYTGFLLSRTSFVVDHIFKEGSLPLWRPSELCGVPTLGNPQIGILYPPNLLILVLGAVFSLGFRFMICLFLAGIFTYLYCREIGMSFSGALFAALAFLLSGFIATNIYAGHIQHISTIVWLPLCLFFIERLVNRRRLIDAVGLGVCLAFQFAAGHPEYFFYSGFVSVLYFLCVWPSSKRVVPLYLLAFASILFVSLAAVQLFPMLEFLSHMTRGREGYEFASAFSFAPACLAGFVFPDVFGKLAKGAYWGPGFYWEQCGYTGVVALVLAIGGAFFTRRARARIMLMIAIFSLLYALGRYTPFHYYVCKMIPPLMRFRVPSRMLFVYSFSIAVLGGMGLEYLVEGRGGRAFRIGVIAAFFALVFGIVSFRLFPGPFLAVGRGIVRFRFNLDVKGPHTMSLSDWLGQVQVFYSRLEDGIAFWPVAFVLGLFAVSMVFYHRGWLQTGLFYTSVLAVLCVELLSFDIPLVQVLDPQKLNPRTEVVDYLCSDRSLFRIMDLSGRLGLEKVEPYGIQTAFNFESGFIRWYADFLTLVRFRIDNLYPGRNDLPRLNRNFEPDILGPFSGNTPLELINCTTRYKITDFDPVQNGLDIMNVKYIILNNPIYNTRFELVFSDGNVYVYLNKRALPRAFLVPDVEVIRDRLKAFKLLADFNPKKAIIIPRGEASIHGGETYRAVEITAYDTDRIQCTVEVLKPACLFLSEIWYPGWEAFSNGEEREVLMADYAFRGVILKPGRHVVEFRYNPVSYRVGRSCSFAGIAFSLILLFIQRRHHV